MWLLKSCLLGFFFQLQVSVNESSEKRMCHRVYQWNKFTPQLYWFLFFMLPKICIHTPSDNRLYLVFSFLFSSLPFFMVLLHLKEMVFEVSRHWSPSHSPPLWSLWPNPPLSIHIGPNFHPKIHQIKMWTHSWIGPTLTLVIYNQCPTTNQLNSNSMIGKIDLHIVFSFLSQSSKIHSNKPTIFYPSPSGRLNCDSMVKKI